MRYLGMLGGIVFFSYIRIGSFGAWRFALWQYDVTGNYNTVDADHRARRVRRHRASCP